MKRRRPKRTSSKAAGGSRSKLLRCGTEQSCAKLMRHRGLNAHEAACICRFVCERRDAVIVASELNLSMPEFDQLFQGALDKLSC